MKEKVCIVTGSNSGIGKVMARELAARNATVVLLCRSRERGERARDEIRAETGNPKVELILVDFASQSQIREAAVEFKRRHSRLDLLINNAGALFHRRHETEDGIEMTLAVNHLGYFILTLLLWDRLQASSPARIVNVASEGHKIARLDLDDLQYQKRRYLPLLVYGQSKLANIMFTYELARRIEGSGVTANAMHPGVVRTNFGYRKGSAIWRAMLRLAGPLMLSPEKGADTGIYLATSADVAQVSGGYFSKRRPIRSSAISYHLDSCRRLWEISLQLSGLSSADSSLLQEAGVSK